MSEPIRKDVAAARRDLANMRRTQLSLPAELVVNRLERILDWADRQLGPHQGVEARLSVFDEIPLIPYNPERADPPTDGQCYELDGAGRRCYRAAGHEGMWHAYSIDEGPETTALAAEPSSTPKADQQIQHTVWCTIPNSGRCVLFCNCGCHLTQSDVALSR